MTLDDAIVAFGQLTSEGFDSLEFDVRDYERLVKWLTELKLARESAFSDIGLAAQAVSENHQLKDENAKLRELLLDVWNDAMEFDGFLDYVYDDGEIYDECVLPHYQERMRELGVEVPE